MPDPTTGGGSVPELELRTVRTREALTDTVATIRQRSNVPERWRLLVARSRLQLRHDPTPLVAMFVMAGVGVASIVGGTLIGRSRAGHLDAAADPMPGLRFSPAKADTKHGGLKGMPRLRRTKV